MLHAVEKLMEQTRKLAAEYYQTTGKTLPVSIELARYDAMHALKLKETPNPTAGVDALGTGKREGKAIQVKARVTFDESKTHYRIGQINDEGAWDLLLLVLFGSDYRPYAIYECPREDLLNALQDNQNPKRSKRGAVSVAKFKALGRLAWSAQEGEIGD